MTTDEDLREALKAAVYRNWRFNKVEPRTGHVTWQKLTTADRFGRLYAAAVLADVLAGQVPNMRTNLPSVEGNRLSSALWLEAMAEHGWGDDVFPDWTAEVEEFKQKLPRGTLTPKRD